MPKSAWIVLLALFAGCDSSPPAPPKVISPDGGGPAVEMESVALLPAGRRTILAPGLGGQLFWVQESLTGNEVVFTMSSTIPPTATNFGNLSVLRDLKQDKLAGSFGGLAFGRDERLYFYLSGSAGKKSVSVVGEHAPGTGETTFLADTPILKQRCGLGDSHSLARGSLVIAGDHVWLWLRHSDDYALLVLDQRQAGDTLRRRFEHVLSDEGLLMMTSPQAEVAGLADGSLLYLDRAAGALWKISPIGQARILASLADLPAGYTMPQADADGRLITFIPTTIARVPDAAPDELAHALPGKETPAMLLTIENGRRRTISLAGAANPNSIDLKKVVPGAAAIDSGAALIVYDKITGRLIRFKWKNPDNRPR